MDRDKLTEKLESLPLKDFNAPVHQARLKNALFAAGAKAKKSTPNIKEKLTGFVLSLGGAFSSKKPVWQAALAGLLVLAIMVIVAISVPGVLRTPNPPAAPVTVTLPALTSYSTATSTITVPAGASVVTVTKTVAGPGAAPTTAPTTTSWPLTFPSISIPPQITPTVTVTVNVPQATLTVPLPTITVVVPTLTIPQITVPTPTFNIPQATVIIPTQPPQATPAYIWVIVAVGAILTIAVIVLIILAVVLYPRVNK